MDSRAQFEAWVADELGHAVEYIKGQRAVSVDRYYNEYIEIPYRAWKASRSAIEIELPEKISPHNTNEGGYVIGQAAMYDEAIDDCAEAIRAIGISIKGESS